MVCGNHEILEAKPERDCWKNMSILELLRRVPGMRPQREMVGGEVVRKMLLSSLQCESNRLCTPTTSWEIQIIFRALDSTESKGHVMLGPNL